MKRRNLLRNVFLFIFAFLFGFTLKKEGEDKLVQFDSTMDKYNNGKPFAEEIESLREADTALKVNVGTVNDFKAIGASLSEKTKNEFEYRGVNVKWYGAKGDGTTDDTSAIQEAINAAYSLKTFVFLPNGIYKVTKSLIVKDSIAIWGVCNRNSPTRWEGVIVSTADKTFVGKTAGTTSSYFASTVSLKNLAIKGKGVGSILFDFFELKTSVISNCMIYNFDYVISGRLTGVSNIHHNRFVNIHTSVLSTRLGKIKSTITDSKIHHNYINGTSKGESILIDLENGNYSDIHNNFIDYAYMGIRLDTSSTLMDISHNLFDVCLISIHCKSVEKTTISDNRIGKCSKTDYTLFASLTVKKQTEYSTANWIGVMLGAGVNHLTIHDNVANKNDILIDFSFYGYNNIKTRGNVNAYSNGKVVNMNRTVDTNNTIDGKFLKIEEMNYLNVITLPKTNSNLLSTFDGNLLYYQGKLVRNDVGIWKDLLGNIVN